MDYLKHGPVVKNIEDAEDADVMRNSGNDVDYIKHGPVLRNFGDAEVIRVDYDRHGQVVRNFGDGGIIHVDVRETWSDREKPRGR